MSDLDCCPCLLLGVVVGFAAATVGIFLLASALAWGRQLLALWGPLRGQAAGPRAGDSAPRDPGPPNMTPTEIAPWLLESIAASRSAS